MGDRSPDPSFTGQPGVSFDDGLFHARMRTAQTQRAHELPRSVSMMRAHTIYDGVGTERAEPLGTATVEELVRHHDPSHRFARVQLQPGGPTPSPIYVHPARHPSHQGFCAGQPAPYYRQNEFWQPRWVDQASPHTAIWNPYSGFIYWDEAACRWVQVSPRR